MHIRCLTATSFYNVIRLGIDLKVAEYKSNIFKMNSDDSEKKRLNTQESV